jgi:hypothetical protein
MRCVAYVLVGLVVGLVVGGSGCGRRTEAEEMDDVCHAGERSGADKVARDERASHTAQWIEKRVKSPAVKKALAALPGTDGDKREILRLIAKEHGYTGPCPMAEWTAEEEHELIAQLRSSPDPRTTLERSVLRDYDSLYDQHVADNPHDSADQFALLEEHDDLIGSPDPEPFAKRLAKAGCPELASSFRPTEPRGRELLAACKARGPAILAAHEVDAATTAYDASRALLFDAVASPQRRASELHGAIVDVLVGPGQPGSPSAVTE